ncbi:uncharacterized protein DUF5019 [Gillisia mitskevichiae]|uniref:Uncharacterized protein DUF5019 n=1 Tax=Gillisia mitskevichiae TaxID=270921 RepID=A0A495PMP6_9FLAO|nr:SusF/SusE family outer membrane protein [Gillisia mitskevichiae]RKS50712.1 uncharacterized protein DUF5019 [Gillisia mitskevichiae]
MKKITNIFIAFIAILSLNACSEDDDFTFTAKPDTEGISFTNSTSEVYTLRASNADNLAERFVWNEVDFDVQTPVNYELQGSATESFESYSVLGDVTVTNLSVTVASMLELAAEAGLDNDPDTDLPNTGNLFFKVRAYVGGDAGNVVDQTSEVLSLTVLLPEGEVEGPVYKQFYLVGDATSAGWNPDNNNIPLFRDSANENIYHYTGRFAGGDGIEGFKLLETLGDWDSQWGVDGDAFTSKAILGGDPSAFAVAADQYYKLMVNREEFTYSFEVFDASAAATYDVVGLVGAGTSVGWPGDDNPTPDIKMTKSDFDEHIWKATDVVLTNGPVKFRANLDWTVNWGGGENFPSGIANGDDIIATAGTYTVWFNDISGRYIFIPVVTE